METYNTLLLFNATTAVFFFLLLLLLLIKLMLFLAAGQLEAVDRFLFAAIFHAYTFNQTTSSFKKIFSFIRSFTNSLYIA